MKEILNPNEWIVMHALWEKSPLTLGEAIAQIGSRANWGYKTYQSYMNVLEKKGFVMAEKRGRDKFYSPAVTREECIESEGDSILEKLGGNGAEKLLLCMMKKTNLSRGAQERMRALIDELSEKEGEEL